MDPEVFWWNVAATRWQSVDWHDWTRTWPKNGLLPNVPPGEAHLVVCCRGDDGAIVTIHPYRVMIVGADGCVEPIREPITDEEVALWRKSMLQEEDTTPAEEQRLEEVKERCWWWALPSPEAARSLFSSVLSAPIGTTAVIRHFIEAYRRH